MRPLPLGVWGSGLENRTGTHRHPTCSTAPATFGLNATLISGFSARIYLLRFNATQSKGGIRSGRGFGNLHAKGFEVYAFLASDVGAVIRLMLRSSCR
jgi:hypothetical protein